MTSHDRSRGNWLDLKDVLVFGGQDRDEQLNRLDNFYLCTFEMDGRAYETIEHAFQSAKFRDYDIEWAEKVRKAATPMEAKRLGQEKKLPREQLDRWKEGQADEIMRQALRAKFTVNEAMRRALLSTNDRPLAEQVDDDPEWDDRRWGIGKQGDGENKLGKMLMELRDELGKNPP